MDLRGLSFDAMPPFEVPYRFFISAPLFVIVVGLLLLVAEPSDLTHRWSNLLLAATHGFTLGFMLMTMLGALFQILPVLAGVALPSTKRLAGFIHFFLMVGVACLMLGLFIRNNYFLFTGALALLVTFGGFLTGLFIRMPKMRSSPTSWTIRLASIALLVTIGFGFAFVVAWIDPSLFPEYRTWTNTHLLWGITGWSLLLIMAVSFQVIPMFYVTPAYPRWVTHYLPPVILALLTLFSLLQGVPVLRQVILVSLALTTSAYAACTLYLLSKRRRKSKDATVWFWNTAMLSYLSAALLFLFIVFYQGPYLFRLELALATIAIVGFALALLTGMLQKIVPFLVWLNLQQVCILQPTVRMPLSNMQEVIPAKVSRKQFWLYVMMVIPLSLMMYGFTNLWFIKLTAILLIATFGYLFYNLWQAKRLYDRLRLKVDEQLQNQELSIANPLKS